MIRLRQVWSWVSLFGALAVGALGAGGCSDEEGSGGFTRGEDLVLSIDPTQIVFSAVNVGATSDRVLTLRHAGEGGVLRIRNLRLDTSSDDLSLGEPSQLDLEPGEALTVTVTYAPSDAIPDEGTIRFDTNVAEAGGGSFRGAVPVVTLAQGAVLRATPGLVDFGAVEGGVLEERSVALINVGQEDVVLTDILVTNASSPDFSITDMPELPLTLEPDRSVQVRVGYVPVGGGSDEGALAVQYELGDERGELSPTVQLVGRQVGPQVEVFPNPVDFGRRATGQTYRQVLNLSNQGERTLVIDAIEALEGSSDTIVLDGFPGPGTTVAPGDILPMALEFTPTTTMVQTTGPLARFRVRSNDPAGQGEYDILAFGRAELPILQVNPPEVLDFGFVPQNIGRVRNVVLFNAGNAPLEVGSLSLSEDSDGEFVILEDARWGPTANPPSAGVIGPLESREVRLEFTNRGADSGVAWGELVIESNDGVNPTWELSLRAGRAGSPTCEIALEPTQRDFGIVARGSAKVMSFNLVNVGSGDCSFHSALVNDCPSFFGFFQGSCDDPANTIFGDGTSRYYRVTRTPLAIQGGLRAGQSYPIEVTFTPPETAPLIGDELASYAGLLAVRVVDPNSGSTVPVVFPEAVVGGLSRFPPNLAARSGIAQLAVLPGEVDFGLTTVGCVSQTIEVTAYNVGSAPLDITDIRLEGCSVEYRIRSSPGLPQTLGVNGNTSVELVYVPQDLGADRCGLAFYTNEELSPTIVVPVSGAGTFETEHTDTYLQTSGQDVDILFVVDNSGSMGNNQSNLANNFGSFIQSAAQWNNDYHIGITTTDLDVEAGRLVSASGHARFVTRANSHELAQNFRVGTNGSPTEQGLAAGQLALSLPLTADSPTVCAVDTECQPPERCVDGFCGGRNRGFLRPDAALEIVMVSDEEDQSPGDINFYVNFFKSIKGVFNTEMMHVHAIVGDASGGCSTSAGSADAGRRYIDVANATGGVFASICDPNFAQGLEAIGDVAFGLRRQFYLARLPEPATIIVSVGGDLCAPAGGANWRFDEGSNSIVFNDLGGCMPQEGQEVVINYSTVCFLD